MSKQHWNSGALIAPVPPTLVTCRHNSKDNVFTVAWTGITNTVPAKAYISVRPKRFSYELIKKSGAFVINLPSSALVRKVDYCGIYTGAKVDKFQKCGFTKEAAQKVDCPLIQECPINIECHVTDVVSLGSHDMFMADIVAVDVDETLIDKNGKLRMDKADLIAFAHGEYFTLGKRIGTFGFSAKKKGNAKSKAPAARSRRKDSPQDRS